MGWSREDPRHSFNKRGRIVVVAPGLDGGPMAFTGNVETKDGWCVFTAHPEHGLVSEDEEWPSHWTWIRAPE